MVDIEEWLRREVDYRGKLREAAEEVKRLRELLQVAYEEIERLREHIWNGMWPS
jgi:hypothetical protein